MLEMHKQALQKIAGKIMHCSKKKAPWIVAESPSNLMISPIRLSWPTRTSSYIAAPPIPSATTTGPETYRSQKLQCGLIGEKLLQKCLHLHLKAPKFGIRITKMIILEPSIINGRKDTRIMNSHKIIVVQSL